MMSEAPRDTKNLILLALPQADYERLLPDLEKVNMEAGNVVYHQDEPIRYVYFHDDAMTSVINQTADGQSIEVGVIGNEGMAGIDVLLGVETAQNLNTVQLAGKASRVKTEQIKIEFKRGGALHDSLLLYTHALMAQITQTALCNRLHSVEERLCRWLLMAHDRSSSDKLKLTQEFLAVMLGASRATVTLAAITLQNAKLISYKRGQIIVLDRLGLEETACDCYAAVKVKYDRLTQ